MGGVWGGFGGEKAEVRLPGHAALHWGAGLGALHPAAGAAGAAQRGSLEASDGIRGVELRGSVRNLGMSDTAIPCLLIVISLSVCRRERLPFVMGMAEIISVMMCSHYQKSLSLL